MLQTLSHKMIVSQLHFLHAEATLKKLFCAKMETTIESLSDDVRLEIFEYLDAKSLRSATLVCKK